MGQRNSIPAGSCPNGGAPESASILDSCSIPRSFGLICYAAIVPRTPRGEAKCSDQNGLLALNKNAFLILFLGARMASLMMSHLAPSHFLTFHFILKHLPRMKLQFCLKGKYLSQGQTGTHAFLTLTHWFLLYSSFSSDVAQATNQAIVAVPLQSLFLVQLRGLLFSCHSCYCS